jgi:hypothetical protein
LQATSTRYLADTASQQEIAVQHQISAPAAEQQQGSAAEEVDAAEEDDAAEQQQRSAAEEAGAGRSRLHQAAVARILAALGAGRTLSAAALRPHSTEWLRGSEAAVADVKRSLRKLVNFPEAGAAGQQDVAVLEAVLAGLPAGSAGRATVEVALAEDFTARTSRLHSAR